MKEIIRFELRKIINIRKTVILSLILIMVCVGSFAIISAMGNWKGAAEMLTYYCGSVENNPRIEATRERWQELYTQYIEKGIEMDEKTREEYYTLEYPLWLERCDEVRKSNLEENGFKADTLIIGNTVFYAFLEEFIANYVPFIMGFIITFLIAPVFSAEYANRMDGLLLSTKYGKQKLIIGKFIAATALILMVYTIVVGVFALITFCVHGLGDLNASFVFTADNVFIYLSSPFNFLVGEYILVMFACSLFGCLGVGCLTLFLSSKCRSASLTSMLSLAVVYIPMLAFKMFGQNEGIVPNILRLFHGAVMGVRTLFSDYFPVRIGIVTITMPVISIVLLCLSSVVFCVFAFRGFQRHQVQN